MSGGGTTGQCITGQWRLIFDLSFPFGHSVNDEIDLDSCSLQQVKVADFVSVLTKFGKGALLAKFDIQSVYRSVTLQAPLVCCVLGANNLGGCPVLRLPWLPLANLLAWPIILFAVWHLPSIHVLTS